MEFPVKVSFLNFALLILLFGFLLRLSLNISSDTGEDVSYINEKLAGFRENIADLTLEISNIKQSMDNALIPMSDSILKVEEQSEKLVVLSEKLDEISGESIPELKESLMQMGNAKGLSLLVQESIPAVVSIRTDNNVIGSGFFVDENGMVLTNAHLLADYSSIQVNTHDHRSYSAELVGIDPKADIALLKVRDSGFHTLKLGDSDKMSAGDTVVAIGNPGGYDFSVAKGVISSTERENSYKVPLFQMDISINPGSSGGPLIDSSGKVIGLTSGYFYSKFNTLHRIGFAIKSNHIQKIINGWLSSD